MHILRKPPEELLETTGLNLNASNSRVIPVIPFFAKMGRIAETVETAAEVLKVLETCINTG